MVVLDLDVLPADINRKIPCLFSIQDPTSANSTNSKDKEQRNLKSKASLLRKRPGPGGKLRRVASTGKGVGGEHIYDEGAEVDDDDEFLGEAEVTLAAVKQICHKSSGSMLCCGRRKDQGRDIPQDAEPAASPRRLQLGQIATLPPQGVGRGRELPPMVLQPDFRKVSGISSEIFKQLEAVENDHDTTTAAALDAVERRGEMLVRMLDPRNQFSRTRQDLVRKFITMQDALHTVHFVEIVKRPGQTLGLYIREGNGLDRYDGVFISRIAIESAVFNSGCLGVGDEILAVNLIDVTHMSLDDVVIIMSIPRRLVLTIRQRKGRMMSGQGSLVRDTSKQPVVVIKKELEEEPYDESNGDMMGHGPHSFSLGHPPGIGMGRGRAPMMTTQGQRLFQPQIQRPSQPQPLMTPSHPRPSPSYQHYANLQQIQYQQSQLPDVTDYTPRIPSRHEDFRLETPQPPIRRPQYDYYDSRPEPPSRPSSQQGYPSYDWYRPGGLTDHHSSLEPSGPSLAYQSHPSVITEQPRSINVPSHFQPYDRAYPKTLESLAEKVHTFYTGPRPVRQGQRSQMRMPRTGSDHRLTVSRSGDAQQWYGSMPRQKNMDYRSQALQRESQLSRYSLGGGPVSSRLSVPSRRKPVVDYASDSEAMIYTPSIRSSSGLGALSASTRRSLGLTGNGRSNSLPRDFIRGGRGGRKQVQNVRFDSKRSLIPDLSSTLAAGRRALLLSSAATAGMDSQDESDGAASAPEMHTPRRDRGFGGCGRIVPSSPGVFTSGDYRSWLTRAPSTSAIYERLKTNRDMELLQTQRAAKFTYSAENLSLLDRARQDQPYYSYRSHLLGTSPATPSSGLIGGDSTLARALAARSPSASSALASLGIRDPSLKVSTSLSKDSLISSSDPLRRLGLTPSRSRDLISDSATSVARAASPTSSLLHRLSTEREKDTDSSLLLRKEILNRSLMGRDLYNRDLLTKDRDLQHESADSIISRLGGLSSTTGITGLTPTARGDITRDVTNVRDGGISGIPGILTRPATSVTGTPSITSSITTSVPGDSRIKLLTINPSEFVRYKIERPSSVASDLDRRLQLHGHSGILRVHLLAGRALRSTVRTTDSTIRTRDLYCVIECDRTHKARTVVCTGDQNFDWDEVFDLDLVDNKELDFLIYSWDPQLRHRLCYKGSVSLVQILSDLNPNSAVHQLAIKVEPRGTLYVKLKHTPPQESFKRELRKAGLFGADVGSVVMREDSGLNVPLIVQRCIEEIERRGLDIIGLYRLCGSSTKKQTLREAFERSPRTVDLSSDNVPDINVIAGVLKDYLRELPEPLLTKCLYQMLVDALGVCLPDDPEGNARLLFSIIECLPKPNRCTLLTILEHLSLVTSLSDRNKMGPLQLATSFGPILMVYYDGTAESLDFQPPIKVLQYLLEVWPSKSVRAAGVEAVKKGQPSLTGKGRFPRSSQASALSSRSQKTISSGASRSQLASQQRSLLLSPTKQSPGSLSESSPSPTSVHSIKAQNIPTSSLAVTTTSSSSGALTLTPSTTSSSLTSVTTPNSLTPVSTAKSFTPATTSSNYSLTSESSEQFSTVISPIPPSKTSESFSTCVGTASTTRTTGEDLFAAVSVRNRVSAFEQPGEQGPSLPTTTDEDVYAAQRTRDQDIVPPSPFPMRKLQGPGHVERASSVEERLKRKLPPLPQQHSLPQQYQPPPSYSVQQQVYSSPQHQFQYSSNSSSSSSSAATVIFGNGKITPSPPTTSGFADPQQSSYTREYEKEPIYVSGSSKVPPLPPPKPGYGVYGVREIRQENNVSKPENESQGVIRGNGEAKIISGSNPPTNGGSQFSFQQWNIVPTTTVPPASAIPASTKHSIESEQFGTRSPPATSSKGASPSATPGSTPPPSAVPPPVPPRLDRRPSQPSPTSSPPSVPPPVPPRLGRAAPVRTPSTETFEVDCYTIKEENGEEDFLT